MGYFSSLCRKKGRAMPKVLINTGSRAIVLLYPGDRIRVQRYTPHLESIPWVQKEEQTKEGDVKPTKSLIAIVPLLLSAETVLYHRNSETPRKVGNVFFVRKARLEEKGETASLLSFAFTLDFSRELVAHLALHEDKYQRLEVWRKIRGVILYDDEIVVCRKGTDQVWVLTRQEHEEALRSL